MKKKFNIKAKLIGLAALAAGAAAVVPAALPATVSAAETSVTSAPTGWYQIVRNINVYYVDDDGNASFGGSAPYTGYVSNKNMKFTFPEVKVADLFSEGLGYWKPNIETIPAVTATYANPPEEVNIYLYRDDSKFLKESKDVTRTIKYFTVDKNGNKADAGSYKDSVTFYRAGYLDASGNKVMQDWTGDYTFKAVETPAKEGYTADISVVPEKKVTPFDSDFTVEVTYKANASAENPAPVTPDKVENGWYRILTFGNKNFSLDVNGATAADKANVQIYRANNSAAQKFYIRSVGNGYYNILTGTNNRNSAVDVTGNGKKRGTNIIQYRVNNADAQKWSIKMNNDGSVTFIHKGSGLALDFEGARYANFTNVATWTPNNSSAQKFSLVKI